MYQKFDRQTNWSLEVGAPTWKALQKLDPRNNKAKKEPYSFHSSHNISIVREATRYFLSLFDEHSLPHGFFNAQFIQQMNAAQKKNKSKKPIYP